MTESVVYAYGVLLPFDGSEATVGDLTGVAGRPVRLVKACGLASAVSDVPADEFTEQAVRLRLEDLDRLERLAREHHTVVEALAGRTAVLPLRLATVHFDDERLRLRLMEQRGHFAELLSRLSGHVEWGVKVYALGGVVSREPPGSGANAGTGRDYLRRRRQEQLGREGAWHAAARLGERVDAGLAGLAADSRRHRPQSGQLSPGPGQNVVNAAYLVPRDRSEEFRVRVRELAAGVEGVRLDVTGPWAPYSFAVLPDEPQGLS